MTLSEKQLKEVGIFIRQTKDGTWRVYDRRTLICGRDTYKAAIEAASSYATAED